MIYRRTVPKGTIQRLVYATGLTTVDPSLGEEIASTFICGDRYLLIDGETTWMAISANEQSDHRFEIGVVEYLERAYP